MGAARISAPGEATAAFIDGLHERFERMHWTRAQSSLMAKFGLSNAGRPKLPIRLIRRDLGEEAWSCCHAVTMNIRGNSYRLKDKLKAGWVRSHDDNASQPGREI
jgi:hypothetical protein